MKFLAIKVHCWSYSLPYYYNLYNYQN